MVKKIIKGLFEKVGLDISINRHWPNLHFFFRSWEKLGLAPGFCVDVGANHGEWTRVASRYFPRSRFVMIEPQERLKPFSRDLLARPNIQWRTLGMSDQPGRLLLSIPERDDGASFLPTTRPANELVAQIEVEVTTLDLLVAQEKSLPNLVKVDAEGLDMRVLKGAASLFGRTEIFFVECSVCANGDNTVLAVCEFMDKAGYRPVEFTDLNRYNPSGALMLCEMAFLLKTSRLLAKV